MEQFLTAEQNKVDAVLSENDGMAGGVGRGARGAGPRRQGAGLRSGRRQAALNRVALGTQAVDVWKDARLLGKAAGEAAAQLCNGTKVDAVTGATVQDARAAIDVSSILLTPNPITKANLSDRPRCRLDHQGRPVQGRDRRLRRRLLAVTALTSRPSALLRPRAGQGAVHPVPDMVSEA